MNRLAGLGAVAAAAALVGAVPGAVQSAPPDAPRSACFYTRDIIQHTVGDAHTIYLNVNNRAYYRVGVTGSCLAAATSSDTLVVRNPPGSHLVCKPVQLDLGVITSGAFTPCMVKNLTLMTPEEVAALPPRVKP